MASLAARYLLALAAVTATRVAAQIPLSSVPASIYQQCTSVNADGTFSANSAVCSGGTPCSADPNRYGAYYCYDPRRLGAYGQPASFDNNFETCDPSLSVGSNVCGGTGAFCTASGLNPVYGIPGSAQCASSYCAPTFQCAPVSPEGGQCATAGCAYGSTCSTYDSTCQKTTPIGSACVANSCNSGQYCKGTSPEAGTCAAIGTDTFDDCSNNLDTRSDGCSGGGLYCGRQGFCRRKVPVGSSCSFDTVNGCNAGAYCTSTDQRCQAISTAAGQSCGPDSNACSTSAGLYCVTSTQLCAKKATTVGASCSFDLANGCTVTSSGQQLYCRSSDATCQVRFNSIGADCRADPTYSCGTITAADGSTTSLCCSMPSFQCAAKLGLGASCTSKPAQACADPDAYCSSNNAVCVLRQNSVNVDGACNADPYAQCGVNARYAYLGYGGQLYPVVRVRPGSPDLVCFCSFSPALPSQTPPLGTFGLTSVGDDCSSDPTFACGYTASNIKLYCAASTGTCQQHVTTVGGSCAYDYLGACGITTDGSYTQLYPSIPAGSGGHADCTCVTQADVIVRPSSRACARTRARRNLSLCPGSHTACVVGSGFECIDTENDLEQCGGCAEQGGVDCTSLLGVAAVGCVGGRCEVWACENGFAFDAATDMCV